MKQRIEFVQRHLNLRGRNAGKEDGLMGKNTRKAMDSIVGLPKNWNDNRKVIGCIQLLALESEFTIDPFDGYWGAQTDYAYQLLQEKERTGQAHELWRTHEVISGNDVDSPVALEWPVEKEDALFKFYGPVGKNQTRIQLPFPHRLAWQPEKVLHSFYCHEKVHDSMLRILNRVLSHYGADQIQSLGLDLYGGCLNVRKIRGGNRYSTHSWGIAIDYDPARNRLRWGSDKAELAKPEYEQWWKFWEEEGWVSLGRLKNYDWMHIQAARR